jgi:hypothetical protein
MKFLGLKTDRPISITLKMANKIVVRLEGVINSVKITIMRFSTIVDFHVVLKKSGAYPMILSTPWLTNMQGTIGVKDT